MNEDKQTKMIKKLYETVYGRMLLFFITKPWFSQLAGSFMDSRLSKCMIRSFVKQNKIELGHYENTKYKSFNDFFTRKIRAEHRPIEMQEHVLIAPADGRLSYYEISSDKRVRIKGHDYLLEELLHDKALADQYEGGHMLVFRLTVADYHRYHYPDTGHKSENVRIDGILHTVNPIAAAARKIYCENAREYFTIDSENFGEFIYIQVGALLVGRIKNNHCRGPVVKGQEAGCFEYGGSTVILCLKKDAVELDPALEAMLANETEVPVKMGQLIGTAISK